MGSRVDGPRVTPAPGRILTPEQSAELDRINALPLGQRIEEMSRIQKIKKAAEETPVNPELAIWARQQAEACRAMLLALPHPAVAFKSLEHYRGQLNAMVVLLFESAARWGIEFDKVMEAGRPIFDMENAKRLDREAKEKEAAEITEKAAKAREAELESVPAPDATVQPALE